MSRTIAKPGELAADAKRIRKHLALVGAIEGPDLARHLGVGRDYFYQALAACTDVKKRRLGDGRTVFMLAAEYESRCARINAANKERHRVVSLRATSMDERAGWRPKRIHTNAAATQAPVTRAPRSVFEWRPA